MQFQKLSFKNAAGQLLAARLDLPLDRKPAAYAVFAHCFTCTKSLNAVVNINSALAREGIAVLRFDFTGLGESEGNFAETGLLSNVSDLAAAARFLESEYEAPKLLIGHSFGGAAVLQAASLIPSASAVAVIGAPAGFSEIARLLGDLREEIETRGEATITLAGRSFKLGRQFLADLDRDLMEKNHRQLEEGPSHIPLARGQRGGNRQCGEDFSGRKTSQEFSSPWTVPIISFPTVRIRFTWAACWRPGRAEYIGIHPERESRRDLSDNRVMVRTGKRGFQTEILANGHSLLADEPLSVGGADTGPFTVRLSCIGARFVYGHDAQDVRRSEKVADGIRCGEVEAPEGPCRRLLGV